MLLRRVIDHVKAQNWTAVALDFVIVVVGVFLGIQVNNWNQSRIDRNDEVVFLRALHKDVVGVERLTGRLFDIRYQYFADLSVAVDILFDRAPARAFSDEECLAMASSHLFYVGRADLPSLTRLRDAGRTSIIRDEPLAQSLATLTQRREAMELVMDDMQILAVDLPQEHPDIFRINPTVMPVANAPEETERHITATCNIERLEEKPAALNGLVTNLEWLDAFLRDGLVPWVTQVGVVHSRLDELLGVSHESPETD